MHKREAILATILLLIVADHVMDSIRRHSWTLELRHASDADEPWCTDMVHHAESALITGVHHVESTFHSTLALVTQWSTRASQYAMAMLTPVATATLTPVAHRLLDLLDEHLEQCRERWPMAIESERIQLEDRALLSSPQDDRTNPQRWRLQTLTQQNPHEPNPQDESNPQHDSKHHPRRHHHNRSAVSNRRAATPPCPLDCPVMAETWPSASIRWWMATWDLYLHCMDRFARWVRSFVTL